MLLEFTLGNYRSFGADRTLSMVSTDLRARDARLNQSNRTQVEPKLSVLKSAVVYGANASGKSNLVRAIRFMRDLVLDSSRQGQAGDPIPTEPFLLHPELPEDPSYFEIVFVAQGTRYRYGFEVDRTRVVGEWLYYVRKREALVFRRDEDEFRVMPEMKDVSRLTSLTRSNALFLSVAAQFNSARATEIVTWFRSMRFLGGIHDESMPWTAMRIAQDPATARRVSRLLARLDVDIAEVTVAVRPADTSDLPAELGALAPGNSATHIEILTEHAVRDDEGTEVGRTRFNLEEHESGGTRKLFALAGPILDVLAHGGVLIVDEFDARLHPVLSRALLELFHTDDVNASGAQLIALTHDTNLLDRHLLRRDQIWFIEKTRNGQSDLFSLASVKVRNDASFEPDYLNGRYGAVPMPRGLGAVVTEGRE